VGARESFVSFFCREQKLMKNTKKGLQSMNCNPDLPAGAEEETRTLTPERELDPEGLGSNKLQRYQ